MWKKQVGTRSHPHLLLPPARCVRVHQALVFLDGENDNFLTFDCVETQLFAAALQIPLERRMISLGRGT